MRRNLAIRFIAVFFTALFISVVASAQILNDSDGIWTNTSGGNWSSTANWFNGQMEYGDDNFADFSTLNISSDVTVNNDISSYTQTVGQMIFGDTDSTNNWNVTGHEIYLMAFFGTPAITVKNKTTTISAVLGGNHGLAVSGPGTLALTGTNIVTGGLTINSGKVQVPSVNNVNTSGPLGNIGNNGDDIVLGSNGNTGQLEYTSASNTSSNQSFTIPAGATGSINVDGGSNFNTSTTLTVSGAISGNGTFRKDGVGVLLLTSNSNFFSNGIIIAAGTLEPGSAFSLNTLGGDGSFSFTQGTSGSLNLNGFSSTIGTLSSAALPGHPIVQNASATAATLTINQTSDSTFAGTLQDGTGGGALSITKTGANTLTLTGTNSFTGALNIQKGTISVPTFNNASANGPLGSVASITLGSSGQTGTIEYTGGIATSSMPLVLASSGTGAIQIDSAPTSLSLSGVISGSGGLNKTGNGTLTLTNTNTFTGALAIKQGAISVLTITNTNTTGPLGSHANITLGDSGTTGTLDYLGLTASTNMPFILATGGTGAIQIDNSASTLTLSAAVTGSGALTKTGPGTLDVSHLTNTFTGGLTVAQGTLVTDTINGSKVNGPLGVNGVTLGSTGQTGIIQYNGGDASPSKSITLAAGGNGEILVNSTANLTLLSSIIGGGGLIKAGPGTLSLNTVNSFTGGLTIQAGTFKTSLFNQPNTVGALGAIPSVTIGTATLEYTGSTTSSAMPINLSGTANISVDTPSANLVLGGPISGAGSFTKSGPGAVTIAGGNTYSGGTALSQGTLTVASATALGSGPLAMGSNTTLNIAGGVSVSQPAGFNLPPGAQINASAGSFSTGGGGSNHGTYSIAAGTLSFNASSGSTTNASDGTIDAVSSTLNFGTATNNLVNSGRLNLIDSTVNGDITLTPGATINTAGNVTFNGSITGSGAMVISDGLTTLAAGSHSAVVSSFSNSGTLDLTNNNMVVNYTSSSPAPTIRSLIASSYNAGNWTGQGITSSTAANDPNQSTALGYAEASDIGLANGGFFAGNRIPSQAVLVKYTYYGDENLDGVVNLDDFSIFIDGFNGLGSGWIYGDFNYDGVVDQNDFALFVKGFDLNGQPLSTLENLILSDPNISVSQKSAMLSVVPEPSCIALIGLALWPLKPRRRS